MSNVQKYIERHSSYAIETATLQLLGVEGEYRGKNCAHWVVHRLTKDQLRLGAAHWWGRALLAAQHDPKTLAIKIAKGKIDWNKLPEADPKIIQKQTKELAEKGLKNLKALQPPHSRDPWLGVVVPVAKARKLVGQIKDWQKVGVSAFRLQLSPQQLLEEGDACEETALAHKATQEEAFRSHWFSFSLAGVNVPETTVTLLSKGVSCLGMDAVMNTMLSGVNLRRAAVDQFFSLLLAHHAGVTVQSAQSDWVRARARLKLPNVLAVLFLQEQFMQRAGLPFEKTSFTHGFPQESWSEQGGLGALAHAQLMREIFPQSQLWFTWNPSQVEIGSWVAMFADQEGVEFSAKEGENHWTQIKQKMLTMQSLQDEIEFNTHGKVARLAHSELEATHRLLKHIHHITLWKAIEEDKLDPEMTGVPNGGIDGVFQKSFHYYNPVMDLLVKKQCQESESY